MPDDQNFPLSANGPAYTARQERDGVPLDYVGEKLERAILELHRYATSRPEEIDALLPATHYLLVSHLGLHNMLGKANDRALARRFLTESPENLQTWLGVIAREGDVRGLAGLDAPDSPAQR